MSFEPLKTLFCTLRFRLMLWNAGAVLLTALLTLGGVREGVRYALTHEMDQVLLEDIREVELTLDNLGLRHPAELHEELNRKARGHSHHEWFIRIYDRRGEPLWASYSAPPRLALPSIGEFSARDSDGYRVVQEIYRRAGQPPVVLRVGISLDYLNRELERIDDLALVATLIAILVAPLGGYWLAGRTTRILGRIIHTTARLRPRKLEERLTVRGTGDELDQLARTINGFLDRIAAYLVQKQDFLANAAHELRSPLAAIRGSIEVALAGNRTSEEYAETLHDLIDQCAALEVLVNQLLMLAETETEQIKIQGEVAVLDDIVARSVEMFRGVAEFHEIELQTSEFPRVVIEGNSSHLRQVLNNLLDNALKFTGPGGTVRVDLEKNEARGEAILRVSDTGAGIPPEDLPIVFDRFYLGDKARQRIGKARGTGLGLSICEAVVQGHGGRIAVESELDRGSTFTVTLPLLQDVPAASLAQAAS